MSYLNQITKDNFNNSFNTAEILKNSVFYPASGIDASDIECFATKYNSFVHVDYSTPRSVIEQGMKSHFEMVGYELVGIKHISKEELTPNGFSPLDYRPNKHEQNRLEKSFIRNRFSHNGFEPFALWAVYELNPKITAKTEGKAKRFSLLHIGGEACATFEALYFAEGINPMALAIIRPGEGYDGGDNWTKFTDPDFRLYNDLQRNSKENGVPMPKEILSSSGDENCFWPGYKLQAKIYIDGYLNHYMLN